MKTKTIVICEICSENIEPANEGIICFGGVTECVVYPEVALGSGRASKKEAQVLLKAGGYHKRCFALALDLSLE